MNKVKSPSLESVMNFVNEHCCSSIEVTLKVAVNNDAHRELGRAVSRLTELNIQFELEHSVLTIRMGL